MKKQISSLLGVSAVLLLTSSVAQAETRFSVFGVGNFAALDDKAAATTVTNTPKLGVGGGAQAEIRMGQSFGLEIGAIYLPRKYTSSDTSSGLSIDSTFNYIQIPVQVRMWLGKYITLGVGGYYAMGIGSVNFSSSGVSGSATYAEVNAKKADYGLVGSLGFDIPLGQSVAILAEGRYTMGLADLNDPADPTGTAKWTDITALVGLRFGMMK